MSQNCCVHFLWDIVFLPLCFPFCNIIWFHPNQPLLGHNKDTTINEVIIHVLVGLGDEEEGCGGGVVTADSERRVSGINMSLKLVSPNIYRY